MGKIQIPHTDHRPLEKNHHCISIKIEIGSSTPKNKKKTVAFHAIFTRRHSGIGFVVYGDNALPSAVGRQRAIIGHHIICFWWQWPLNAGGTRPLNPKKGAKTSRKGRFSGFWIRPFWVVGILVRVWMGIWGFLGCDVIGLFAMMKIMESGFSIGWFDGLVLVKIFNAKLKRISC